jgi:hypothetical protein
LTGFKPEEAVEKKEKRFKAVLEPLADGLGWTVVRVPFVPAHVAFMSGL